MIRKLFKACIESIKRRTKKDNGAIKCTDNNVSILILKTNF